MDIYTAKVCRVCAVMVLSKDDTSSAKMVLRHGDVRCGHEPRGKSVLSVCRHGTQHQRWYSVTETLGAATKRYVSYIYAEPFYLLSVRLCRVFSALYA